MHVTLYLRVNPEHMEEFIQATRLNHEAPIPDDDSRRFYFAIRRESGLLRFH